MNTKIKIKKTLEFLSFHLKIKSTEISPGTSENLYNYYVYIYIESIETVNIDKLTEILDKIFESENVGFILYRHGR